MSELHIKEENEVEIPSILPILPVVPTDHVKQVVPGVWAVRRAFRFACA